MATKKDKSSDENGSKTNLLKLRVSWKNAIKRAFCKKKPKDGWPKKVEEKRAKGLK